MIQVEGCAPMVHAWHQNRDASNPCSISAYIELQPLPPVIPAEHIPYYGKMIKSESGGTFESVTDEEAFRAMHLLANMEGLSVEPAAAVAFAGLVKLVRAGIVKHSMKLWLLIAPVTPCQSIGISLVRAGNTRSI